MATQLIDALPSKQTAILTTDAVLEDETPSLEEKLSVNPFSDPDVAAHYRGLYEKVKYECRHVFDPDLQWTQDEERKLVRKLDLRVCLWACTMFFALQVDRGNLRQAVSDNFLKDLNMTTDDYDLGNTVFFISFLLAELPSQLVSKLLGPDRWIPAQMVLWSIVACSQAALKGRPTFLATRALLGILEGGFIADLVLWLSYFYTSRELPIRLSFFWTSLSVTGIVTSLLAYALLHMEGVRGLAGWRWLFLIEGLITLLVGIAAAFLMPASAVQTKTWFRPKGWFTDREVGIVVNRVLRDDPSKGDMHNRMPITPKQLWSALMDYDIWPIYALGLIIYLPMGPPSMYLTLSLRQLGFNTFTTNLLTIPCTAIGIVTLLGITWISERVNERAMIAMIQNIWTLPCLIALRFWSGANKDAWGTFALATTLLSYPYCHAILVVQLGNIVSANIYRSNDAPLYHHGNVVLIGLNILSLGLFVFAKVYYISRNRWKERKWQAMSQEERREYMETTTDQGNRRLDFRFAH